MDSIVTFDDQVARLADRIVQSEGLPLKYVGMHPRETLNCAIDAVIDIGFPFVYATMGPSVLSACLRYRPLRDTSPVYRTGMLCNLIDRLISHEQLPESTFLILPDMDSMNFVNVAEHIGLLSTNPRFTFEHKHVRVCI